MSGPGTQGPVAPATPAQERTACQRPECDGTYDDVGGGELYCDTCGLAPVVSPTGLVASPPTGITAGGHDSQGARSGSGGAGSGRSSRTSSQSSKSRRSVSGRLSRSLSGRTAAGRSVSVRSSGSGGSSSGRGRLGAGLVQVPPIPRPDPRRMVLDNP
ncbi:serine/threonine protein kinase, partial [Streptomyces werraensis]